jgi:general L-amino acid transport system permease protein
MAQTEIHNPIWVNRNHPQPARKAPPSEVGWLGWLRTNLFSSVGNSLLTMVTALAVYYLVTSLVRWGMQAAWEPVWANRKLLAVGTYPVGRVMQPMLVLILLSLLFGISAARWGSLVRNVALGLGAIFLVWTLLPSGNWLQVRMGVCLALLLVGFGLGRVLPISNQLLTLGWLLFLPLSLAILHGGVSLLGLQWYPLGEGVPSSQFGGLLLTSLLTVLGITLSFPIGVALALGRRSKLPVVHYFCVAYIELIRGVPLISLLFMAMVALPLFLPAGMANPANVTRAVVAITLFSAAYLAETVRGGLQAVPRGQYEAADALGLSGWQKLRLIVLPQALRAVIPAIVNQFIGLFKDTSLVALVGLADFLNVSRSILVQPAWSQIAGGITREVYLSVAAVYLIFSFGMSWASRRIEAHLGVGKR